MVFGSLLSAQQPQNPSPMLDHTRRHDRIRQVEVTGRRTVLSVGTQLHLAHYRNTRTPP